MTWTLKSGRVMPSYAKPQSLIIGAIGGSDLRTTGCGCCEGSVNEITPDERREIADAVKACWDRWAETGVVE